jgi:hypothetical protein
MQACSFSPDGPGGTTVTGEIRLLAADDKAIAGNWDATATGSFGPEPTATQAKAFSDLGSYVSTFLTGLMPDSQVHEQADALSWDAYQLIHAPDSGWQAAGPLVHQDIRALAKICAP